MIRRFLTATVFATGLGLAGSPLLAQSKWDLASAYAPSSFQTLNLQQFAADVEKAAPGKLKITVHANASLFKLPEIKRAVQSGQVEAGEIALLAFQNEWQIFGADSQPFLSSTYEEAMRLYQAQKPLLEKKLAQQGMLLLYTVPWPPQGLFITTPVNSVADFRGMKWRSYSPSTGRLAELFAAQPVTIQAAELSQALATGVVQAVMTSPTTGVETKMWESVKYYYDVQAWMPKNAVLVNRKAFERLDKETRDAVLSAAAAAETRGWKASATENTNALNTLKANGMVINTPSDQMKDQLRKIGETMVKEWEAKAGPEGEMLLRAYRR